MDPTDEVALQKAAAPPSSLASTGGPKDDGAGAAASCCFVPKDAYRKIRSCSCRVPPGSELSSTRDERGLPLWWDDLGMQEELAETGGGLLTIRAAAG
jgi:hypothetical protein